MMQFQESSQSQQQQREQEPKYQRSAFHTATFLIWHLSYLVFFCLTLWFLLSNQFDTTQAVLSLLLTLALLAGVERWVDSVAENPLKPSKRYYWMGQVFWWGFAGLYLLLGVGALLYGDVFGTIFFFLGVCAWFLVGRRYMDDNKNFFPPKSETVQPASQEPNIYGEHPQAVYQQDLPPQYPQE